MGQSVPRITKTYHKDVFEAQRRVVRSTTTPSGNTDTGVCSGMQGGDYSDEEEGASELTRALGKMPQLRELDL
eukprot:3930568-Rhodomonas_salina.1